MTTNVNTNLPSDGTFTETYNTQVLPGTSPRANLTPKLQLGIAHPSTVINGMPTVVITSKDYRPPTDDTQGGKFDDIIP